MDNWIFLVLAYTIGWLGVLFYIFMNAKKQAMIERKIEDMESMLAEKDRH
jgi:CcmD family protein